MYRFKNEDMLKSFSTLSLEKIKDQAKDMFNQGVKSKTIVNGNVTKDKVTGLLEELDHAMEKGGVKL